MASFLSAIQKQNIDSVLDRIHDTFAGDIYVYIEKETDVSLDLNFNALYSSSNVNSHTKTLTRHTVFARVKYLNDQKEAPMQNNLPDSKGRVRIKISPEDYEKVKICTKIEIKNVMYFVNGDASIEGMFSNNYYTVYLEREN